MIEKVSQEGAIKEVGRKGEKKIVGEKVIFVMTVVNDTKIKKKK